MDLNTHIAMAQHVLVQAQLLGVDTDDMMAAPALIMCFIGFMFGMVAGGGSGFAIAQAVNWATIQEALGMGGEEK